MISFIRKSSSATSTGRRNRTLLWSLFACIVIQAAFIIQQYSLKDLSSLDPTLHHTTLSHRGLHAVAAESKNEPRTSLAPGADLVYFIEDGSETVALQGRETQTSSSSSTSGSTSNPRIEKPTIWSLSLDELVNTNNYTKSKCADSRLFYMEDSISPNAWERIIPKIVHVTGKTRCVTQPFKENLNKWRKIQDHSFYFHDDIAMERLLQSYWPEFPQLQIFQHCVISGAGKADLWRYLLLYRYGGIYTDIDNAPGIDFFPNKNDTSRTIISDDDDSFFVVEQIGVLSQYFMASSPKHPIMYMAIMETFSRLMETNNIGTQNVPFVTGPGALKNAFIRFKGGTKGGQVTEGQYVNPINNRSITVKGKQSYSNQYIQREAVRGHAKRRGYMLMGMKHFSNAKDPKLDLSCYWQLYNVANPSS